MSQWLLDQFDDPDEEDCRRCAVNRYRRYIEREATAMLLRLETQLEGREIEGREVQVSAPRNAAEGVDVLTLNLKLVKHHLVFTAGDMTMDVYYSAGELKTHVRVGDKPLESLGDELLYKLYSLWLAIRVIGTPICPVT